MDMKSNIAHDVYFEMYLLTLGYCKIINALKNL